MEDDVFSQLEQDDSGNEVIPHDEYLASAGFDSQTNPPDLGGLVNALPRAPQPVEIMPKPIYYEGFNWENFFLLVFILIVLGGAFFLLNWGISLLYQFHYV